MSAVLDFIRQEVFVLFVWVLLVCNRLMPPPAPHNVDRGQDAWRTSRVRVEIPGVHVRNRRGWLPQAAVVDGG